MEEVILTRLFKRRFSDGLLLTIGTKTWRISVEEVGQ